MTGESGSHPERLFPVATETGPPSIGDALETLSREHDQCSDAYLYSRLLGFIEIGWVETEGDPWAMHLLQVRRATEE
jgi:hypothetical protein